MVAYKIKLSDAIINGMTIREINRHFRREDESEKWPVCGRFNATERAIRRLRDKRRNGLEVNEGLEYFLALEQEIINVVNGL